MCHADSYTYLFLTGASEALQVFIEISSNIAHRFLKLHQIPITSYHPIHFLAPMPLLKLFLSVECFLPPFHWSTFYFSLKTHLKSLLSPHTFPYFPSLCSHIPQFNFALQCSPSHICFFQLEQKLVEGTGNLCYLLCVPSPWPGMWSLINICFEWHVVSSPLWSRWSLL